jgi:hypothetical protein
MQSTTAATLVDSPAAVPGNGTRGLSRPRRFGYPKPVLLWVHLAATGLFIGATAGLAVFAVPAARRVADAGGRRALLARALRVYDPLAIALLGIMVMTGAWSVTAYKQALGSAYFASFGEQLAWKLALAFLVVLSGTYVTFGLGHRIVRAHDLDDPADPGIVASQMTRLRGAAWATVLLTAGTIAAALRR